MLSVIPYKAGVVKDDPEFTARGWAVDSQWVRAVDGYFQSQGGWEKRLTQQFDGIARGDHEWTTSTNVRNLAFGTNTKLYVCPSGWIANITPTRDSGVLGLDPITTVIGDATVTIADTAHGMYNGATAFLGNATAVGGITLAPLGSLPAGALSTTLGSNVVTVAWTSHGLSTGWELILTGGAPVGGITPAGTYLIRVIDANYLQFYSATEATSTATGGGTPTYVSRRPFTITYVDANTYTIEYDSVATGSATGGGAGVQYLYELNPGRLYGSAGTGYGSSGYSTGGYGASTATGVSPNDAAVWCLDNYGDVLTANRIGTTIYVHAGNWSARAQIMTNAPDEVEWHCVTPNRTVMAFGCSDEDTGDFDPMLIRFTDSLDYTIWDIDLTNNAGSLRLGDGSRLIGGGNAMNTIMCWTDTSHYQINFVGNYEQMYQDQRLGGGFGLIGPLAWMEIGDMVSWVTTEASFAYYSGGAPKALQCKSQQYVSTNLSAGQNFKVFAFHDTRYNAVSWGYATDPTQEVTDYIRLDLDGLEPTGAGGWSVGTFSRSSWLDAHSFANPIAFGLDGYIYNHESGNGDDGAALTRFVEWAPIDVKDGDRVFNCNRIVQDRVLNSGVLQFYLYFKRWPQDTATTKGPYSITSTSVYNRVRGQGRQMGYKLFSETNNDDWRVGLMRADLSEGARR